MTKGKKDLIAELNKARGMRAVQSQPVAAPQTQRVEVPELKLLPGMIGFDDAQSTFFRDIATYYIRALGWTVEQVAQLRDDYIEVLQKDPSIVTKTLAAGSLLAKSEMAKFFEQSRALRQAA